MAGLGYIQRGDLWLHEFPAPDKRRPVVILSRTRTLPLLHTVIVAPVTTRIRGLDSEVIVGVEEGLKEPSVINLDHVQIVEQRELRHYLGALSEEKMRQVCRALAIATGCA